MHCCRLCHFYNPVVTSQCDEERSEEVRDKEGANFCDWFKPRPDAHIARHDIKSDAAKARLNELFGEGQNADKKSKATHEKLDDLFSPGKKSDQ